ncbi:hypothetical protein Tco_0576749 [Tanacetum coccineum]
MARFCGHLRTFTGRAAHFALSSFQSLAVKECYNDTPACTEKYALDGVQRIEILVSIVFVLRLRTWFEIEFHSHVSISSSLKRQQHSVGAHTHEVRA